jgi:hypothetical protein
VYPDGHNRRHPSLSLAHLQTLRVPSRLANSAISLKLAVVKSVVFYEMWRVFFF